MISPFHSPGAGVCAGGNQLWRGRGGWKMGSNLPPPLNPKFSRALPVLRVSNTRLPPPPPSPWAGLRPHCHAIGTTGGRFSTLALAIPNVARPGPPRHSMTWPARTSQCRASTTLRGTPSRGREGEWPMAHTAPFLRAYGCAPPPPRPCIHPSHHVFSLSLIPSLALRHSILPPTSPPPPAPSLPPPPSLPPGDLAPVQKPKNPQDGSCETVCPHA